MNFVKIVCTVFVIGFCFLSCKAAEAPPGDNSEKMRTVVQTGHNSSVLSVYFSKDDRMFLSISYGLVKLWDVDSKRLISTWDKRPEGVEVTGFDVNDHVIGVKDQVKYTLSCIDGAILKTEVLKEIGNNHLTSENVCKTITDEDASKINVWKSQTGRYLVSSPKHPGGMWVRHTGFGLALHDLQTEAKTMLHEEERWIWDIAISGDGRFLVCIEERQEGLRELRFYDLLKGTMEHKIVELSEGVTTTTDDYENEKYEKCMVSHDGSRVMAISENSSVYIWRTSDWKLIYYFLFGQNMTVDYHALNMNGNLLAMRVPGDNHCVKVIELETGKIVKEFPLTQGGDDHAFAFSPDGRFLACVPNNRVRKVYAEIAEIPTVPKSARNIVVWDYETGKQIKIIRDDQMYIHPFGFSNDSKYLLCGFDIFRIKDGEKVKSIPEMNEKDIESVIDEFGLFWVHHSQFAMNPLSSYYLKLDQNTGNMVIRDKQTHAPAYEIFGFSNGVVMVTPDGYFSGTGEYRDKVHFVKGRTVYPLEAFYNEFHRPDIVKSRMGF